MADEAVFVAFHLAAGGGFQIVVAAEVEQRVRRFRGDRPRPVLRDKTVILVDDGIATGGTVRAAILALKAEGPKRIVLAVPIEVIERHGGGSVRCMLAEVFLP